MLAQHTIPAARGIAMHVPASHTIKIINTYGTQVVDTWAFTLSAAEEIQTQMSMQHTRSIIERTIPKVGDGLYDNERRKLFTVVEDTTPGAHDTLIAACDPERYVGLGVTGGHRNCSDNLVEALEALGIKAPQFTPSPLNLFMNIPIHLDFTSLSFEEPTSDEGQYISLKAEVDLVIAFSACPQDIVKINGDEIVDAHFQIL